MGLAAAVGAAAATPHRRGPDSDAEHTKQATSHSCVIPYLDDQKRGLLAPRAPCRPNPIGMSPVRLLGVESNLLTVADVDMLDGTPRLDIKPYAPHFDCFEVTRCGWLDQAVSRRDLADRRFEKGGQER